MFNFFITMCVGMVMLIGAGLTYKYRMMEMEHHSGPPVVVASPGQFAKNVAALHSSLPKWDDKNWKGLTHHRAGYYKKKADASRQEASKQNAVR